MIPVGQPYVAAGKFDPWSALTALILGTVAAGLAASMVWLWEFYRIPTSPLFTPLIQGALIGFVLSLIMLRLRMRDPKLAATLGIACGLASVFLFHYGHYLKLLARSEAEHRAEVKADRRLTPERRGEILDQLGKDPEGPAHAYLAGMTGHPGLLGSLILRNEFGAMFEDATPTGWPLYLLLGSEAALVAGMAAWLAATRAAKPFCEDCGDWCVKEEGRLIFSADQADGLAEAVRSDDLAGVRALRDPMIEVGGVRPPRGVTSGTTLYACPACDQAFADVRRRIVTAMHGKEDTTTKALIKRIRISPEMAGLLRAGPAAGEVAGA